MFAIAWLLAAAVAAPSIDSPLKTGAHADSDAALIIGIEDYAFIADVPFASRDAKAFYDLAVYTLGVPAERVRLLNNGAAKEQIEKAAADVGAMVKGGGTAWVYFAGHGAADPSTGARLLLGDDTRQDPTAFSARAVTVDGLTDLAGAGGGTVNFLTDACYGGLGRGGAEIAPGKRFAVPTYAVQDTTGKDLYWYAASGDQLAGPYADAQHGAFTYLAVGALRGWADGELDDVRDGKVTAREANAFVARSLSTLQITDQTPEISGSRDQVLISSDRLEPAPELRPGGGFSAPGGVVATQPNAQGVPAPEDLLAVKAWTQQIFDQCVNQHNLAANMRTWYVNYKVQTDGSAKTTMINLQNANSFSDVPFSLPGVQGAHGCIKDNIQTTRFPGSRSKPAKVNGVYTSQSQASTPGNYVEPVSSQLGGQYAAIARLAEAAASATTTPAAPAPYSAAGLSGGVSGVPPMSNQAFEALVQALDRKVTSASKIPVLESAAFSSNFSMAQVAVVLPMFLTDANKLDALEVMSPRIVDRQNGHLITGIFMMSANSERALQLIR
jgi:hypothetical protein